MTPLKPFSPLKQNIAVHGRLQFTAQQVVVEFQLLDPEHCVLDAPVAGRWQSWDRADELWTSTCFEAFFALPDHAAYWELNLSPARQKWNLYAFDGYRTPQPPRASTDFELIGIEVSGDILQAQLKSARKIPALEGCLCAVVRTDAGIGYLAERHKGAKADFHLRSSFVRVELPS